MPWACPRSTWTINRVTAQVDSGAGNLTGYRTSQDLWNRHSFAGMLYRGRDRIRRRNPEFMHPLVEQVESLFLHELERLAADLRKRFSAFQFNVYRGPVGDLTEYQGYDVGLECIFPSASSGGSENISLSVDLCHLTSKPKVMARAEGGKESSTFFRDNWSTSTDWLEATPETLRDLAENFPRISKAFEAAVQRAASPRDDRK